MLTAPWTQEVDCTMGGGAQVEAPGRVRGPQGRSGGSKNRRKHGKTLDCGFCGEEKKVSRLRTGGCE